jgi:acetyl-CoA carboxylase carboxyltransferase component
VVSRYHGGAFVVFSAFLNEDMEVAAVDGSYASVIGGGPAAAVVFVGEVEKRVEADERVAALNRSLDQAEAEDVARLRAEAQDVRAAVRTEKQAEVAEEFDRIHTVQRAQDVGSVHRIIPAGELRPYLIEAVARGMAR